MQPSQKKNLTLLMGVVGSLYVLNYTSTGRRIKYKVRKAFTSTPKK